MQCPIGREEEYNRCKSLIDASIHSAVGGCLYVTGVPGTGKSATIKCLVDTYQRHYQIIEINALALRVHPLKLYVLLSKALTKVLGKPSACIRRLEEFFQKQEKQPIILIVDELDQLLKKRTEQLYKLFEWTLSYPLVIIAISNVLDLPDMLLNSKIVSRMSFSRVYFSPYTHVQLLNITSPYGKLLSRDVLEYCARKVSSICGDARKAIYVTKLAQNIIRRRKNELLIRQVSIVDSILNVFKISNLQDFSTVSLTVPENIILQAISITRKSHADFTFNELYRKALQIGRLANHELEWRDFLAATKNLQDSGIIMGNDEEYSSKKTSVKFLQDSTTLKDLVPHPLLKSQEN